MFIKRGIIIVTMSLKEILEKNPQLTVESFQELQRQYDQRFVAEEFTGFDKVRHTYAHMGKLFGRLAEYVQMVEDGHKDFSSKEIREKVIPDLLVYAVWLAEEVGVNIEEAYLHRFVGNIKRLHADKVSPEELVELENYIGKRFPKRA